MHDRMKIKDVNVSARPTEDQLPELALAGRSRFTPWRGRCRPCAMREHFSPKGWSNAPLGHPRAEPERKRQQPTGSARRPMLGDGLPTSYSVPWDLPRTDNQARHRPWRRHFGGQDAARGGPVDATEAGCALALGKPVLGCDVRVIDKPTGTGQQHRRSRSRSRGTTTGRLPRGPIRACRGLDATNWRAELAIRFGLILRMVWGATAPGRRRERRRSRCRSGGSVGSRAARRSTSPANSFVVSLCPSPSRHEPLRRAAVAPASHDLVSSPWPSPTWPGC
jgi:hypothetical protein